MTTYLWRFCIDIAKGERSRCHGYYNTKAMQRVGEKGLVLGCYLLLVICQTNHQKGKCLF